MHMFDSKKYHKKYYLKNKKKLLDRSKNYYKLNKEQKLEYQKKYILNNFDKIANYKKNYAQSNKNKIRKYSRKNQYKYQKSRNFIEAKRRALKNKASPKWLTIEQIKQIKYIYLNCPKGYHVDHVIPLKGKEVSGLHVPWNLQYLPALENIKKSNKLSLLDNGK